MADPASAARVVVVVTEAATNELNRVSSDVLPPPTPMAGTLPISLPLPVDNDAGAVSAEAVAVETVKEEATVTVSCAASMGFGMIVSLTFLAAKWKVAGLRCLATLRSSPAGPDRRGLWFLHFLSIAGYHLNGTAYLRMGPAVTWTTKEELKRATMTICISKNSGVCDD